MSKDKNKAEARRNKILAKVRNFSYGIGLNCEGGMGMSKDIKRLIADGKVKIERFERSNPTGMPYPIKTHRLVLK